MKKEDKRLYNIIKKLKGNVLIIGIEDEQLLDAINKNLNIVHCNMLNAITNISSESKKKKGIKKNFQIKKLRRKFHKKKIDDILCNIDDIYPYLKTLCNYIHISK